MRLKHVLSSSLILVGVVFATYPVSCKAGILDYFGDKAAEALQAYLQRDGIDLSWKNFSSEKTGDGIFTQDWMFSADDVCVETQSVLAKVCFSQIHAAIQWKIQLGIPAIKKIGPIAFKGGRVQLQSTPSSKTKSVDLKQEAEPIRTFDLSLLTLPEMLQHTHFEKVQVDVPSIRWEQAKSKVFVGNASLLMEPEKDSVGPFVFNVMLESEKSKDQTITLEGKFHSESHFREGDSSLELIAKAKLPEQGSGKLALKLRTPGKAKPTKASVTLEGAFKNRQGIFDLQAKVFASKDNLQGTLSGDFKPQKLSLPKLSFNQCDLSLKHDLAAMRCPMVATLPNHVIKNHEKLELDFPHSLQTTLQVKIRHEGLVPQPSRFRTTKVQLDIQRIENSWMKLMGTLRGTFSGRLDQPDNIKKFLKGSFDLKVTEFQKLVSVLGRGDFAIPAPLREMKGSYSLNIRPQLKDAEKTIRALFEFKSNLTSDLQALQFTMQGKSELDFQGWKPKRLTNSIDVDVDQIRLVLPPIDPYPVPQFGLDNRFVYSKDLEERESEPVEATTKTFPVDTTISVRTKHEGGIEIVNRITKKPLPISLNVHMDPLPHSQGWIRIGRTPLNLFRRDAFIEHFDVNLRNPTEESLVKGRVSVNYVDYRVLINLEGTLKQPKIVMQSEPPLPEEDIISVLIYGEPLSNLDSSDSGSVGKLGAAIADRAVTLFSLYLFASTPIQSVGYNPETGKVSARMKLAEGTSLVLGSSSEGQEAGIRRRLGYGWYLTSLYHSSSGHDSSRVSALLEWLKRF